VAAPSPRIVGEPDVPEYYIIEPVDADVIYVPIYDPYLVYGVWPYPAYRPFYWYPSGYVALGVAAFGAPIAVGAALWATYDWHARRVAIDTNRFNTFNRTALANQTWQHNPLHRGNLPCSNPMLQQQFGKAGTGVQGPVEDGKWQSGAAESRHRDEPAIVAQGRHEQDRTGQHQCQSEHQPREHQESRKPQQSPNHQGLREYQEPQRGQSQPQQERERQRQPQRRRQCERQPECDRPEGKRWRSGCRQGSGQGDRAERSALQVA
jgi:hypothetical protein